MEMQVTSQQPNEPEVITAGPRSPPRGFVTFSIIILIFMGAQLCLPAMVCVIPGLLLAVKVRIA